MSERSEFKPYKVHANDFVGAVGDGGDLGNGDGTRVGGENCVGRREQRQLAKDLRLQIGILTGGLIASE